MDQPTGAGGPCGHQRKFWEEYCGGLCWHRGYGHWTNLHGGEIIAALDHNVLACQHLRLNAHGTVFEADVRDQKALQEIHRLLANEGTTLMGGIPCQPYSRHGQQKAMADSRAHTLEDILQAADLWNVQAVILECVPGIQQCSEAMEKLDSFVRLKGWLSTDPGPRGSMANLTQKVVVHHDHAEHPA